MEAKLAAFTWSIPSISNVIDSKLDEMNITVDSVFKVQLNFTKMAYDQIYLYVLPLIPISGFKFTITKWFNDPRLFDDKAANSEKLSLPTVLFECVPPINWIPCHKMSVKQIKNEITAHYNYFNRGERVNAIGINFNLEFSYAVKINNSGQESSILHDYEQLLTSGKFHDSIIKTNDGKEIKVHKNILAVRCEVLNAAFEHKMIESTTNIIESPFDNNTMENILLYLYCHKTPETKEIAEKLLVAADYYQLNDLKNKCAEVLIENLSGDNALNSLELGLTHSCKILEDGVLNFINSKSISAIVNSEDWMQSVNVEIFKKISEHCVVLFNKI